MAAVPRGEASRDRITETAFRLFLERGYHGTSMRRLASRAELTPAAIYNHFENKEALYLSVLLERVPHHAAVRALASAQGDDVETLVQDALERMHAALSDQLDNFRLLLIEITEFRGRHASTVVQQFMPEAVGFIRRLQALDPRLEGYPTLLLARAFFGLFISYVVSAFALKEVPGFKPDSGELKALGDVFLRGVLR